MWVILWRFYRNFDRCQDGNCKETQFLRKWSITKGTARTKPYVFYKGTRKGNVHALYSCKTIKTNTRKTVNNPIGSARSSDITRSLARKRAWSLGALCKSPLRVAAFITPLPCTTCRGFCTPLVHQYKTNNVVNCLLGDTNGLIVVDTIRVAKDKKKILLQPPL